MKIIGAHWTPEVNWIEIQCACEQIFDHRADRWKVICPACGSTGRMTMLRDEYASRHHAVRERQIELRHPA